MNKYSAVDYWFSYVVAGNQQQGLVGRMYESLKNELPKILSVISERNCNLHCQHCIFQKEDFKNNASSINELTVAVTTMVQQMQVAPIVVHEGRIFKPAHLQWLLAVRKVRPDSAMGMIDNGSYLQHVEQIKSSGFKFDWLDISLDGVEAIHNRQRNSNTSFTKALAGIKNAHKVLSPIGSVHSLFTLTRINYDSILKTCSVLPEEVKKWHITTMSPTRSEIETLVLTEKEFAISWRQICQANLIRPLVFRTYTADDLLKLAKAVGKQIFLKALSEAQADIASISFVLDGVEVIYYPKSICVNETFVIDVDSCYRVPYSIAYTLKEMNAGISRYGENLKKYFIGKVTSSSNFVNLYRKCAEHWQKEFSQEALVKEKSVFKQIKTL
jgi:hypothetical protein